MRKPVRFIGHAIYRLGLANARGFNVSQEAVIESVYQPDSIVPSGRGRYIIQSALDDIFMLRIVVEENDEIVIVTLYPARRDRYEV